MNTRWLRAAAYVAVSGIVGAAAVGCDDPVDITPSAGGTTVAAPGQPVGTTTTTSAELPSTGADDTTSGNQAPGSDRPAAPQTAQPAQQAQTTATGTGTTPAQPSNQTQPAQGSQQQQTQQTQASAPPADTSGYGSLPMPNAETQVGSYSSTTTVTPGGTGPYVVNASPTQSTNGNASSVNTANAPNASSTSASNAVTNASAANAAVAVGALGTANDLAPANRQSSQNVYNNTATTAPATSRLRSAATVATPVQAPSR